MVDYDEMYKVLFRAQVKAIRILQEAQQTTEEMYISAKPPDIRLFGKKSDDDGFDDEQ